MMKNPVICLVISTLIFLAVVARAQAQSVTDLPKSEVEVRGIVSIPSGESNFSTTGSSGTTIDFGRDFDFKTKLGFGVRYTYRPENKKHKFLVEYSSTSWNRSTTLSRSFTFLGQTFLANLSATGDLKLRVFRAMYAYRWGNEKIRFGPMGDMGFVKTSLDISGTTNNGTRSAEGSITKFAATIGYDLDYDPTPKVNIFHNLGAIAFQGEHLFHTEGGVKFFPSPHVGVSGGYKFERYRVEDNDNFITIRAHGPFFGGILRF